MEKQNKLRIVVFHDVLCTWCYIAHKNFVEAIRDYKDSLEITYRVWLLYTHDFKHGSEKAKEMTTGHWEEARNHPGGESINPDAIRGKDFDFPYSIPTMAAVKCAEIQKGPDMHSKYYEAIQDALYIRGENVNDENVLLTYAAELNLDTDKFLNDFRSGKFHEEAIREFEKAKELGINAIPVTVVGKEMIVGAVSVEEFKEAIERQLRYLKEAA